MNTQPELHVCFLYITLAYFLNNLLIYAWFYGCLNTKRYNDDSIKFVEGWFIHSSVELEYIYFVKICHILPKKSTCS